MLNGQGKVGCGKACGSSNNKANAGTWQPCETEAECRTGDSAHSRTDDLPVARWSDDADRDALLAGKFIDFLKQRLQQVCIDCELPMGVGPQEREEFADA